MFPEQNPTLIHDQATELRQLVARHASSRNDGGGRRVRIPVVAIWECAAGMDSCEVAKQLAWAFRQRGRKVDLTLEGTALPEQSSFASEEPPDLHVVDVGLAANDHDSFSPMAPSVALWITTAEPQVVMRTYAACKALRLPEHCIIGVLVKGADSLSEAREVHQRLDQTCRRFLGRVMHFAGVLSRNDRGIPPDAPPALNWLAEWIEGWPGLASPLESSSAMLTDLSVPSDAT